MDIAVFISAIFNVASEVVSGIGTLLAEVFGLFFTTTPTFAFTDLGTVAIAIIGAPIAWGLINWVFSLFQKIRVGRGGKR